MKSLKYLNVVVRGHVRETVHLKKMVLCAYRFASVTQDGGAMVVATMKKLMMMMILTTEFAFIFDFDKFMAPFLLYFAIIV